MNICIIENKLITASKNCLKTILTSILFITFFVGCSNKNDSNQVEVVKSVEGILMPESAAAMGDGRIIISEIGEFGKNGDGKIIQILLNGDKKIIADSGLNDPKGLIVLEDSIYVTDNDIIKKVSMKGEVENWLSADDFPRKPQFLNDITSDGNIIFISDSGDLLNGKGGGAIFKVDSNKKVSVLVDETNNMNIRSPNGLSTHQDGYLTFNDFENGFLFRVKLSDLNVEKLGEGYGGADGLVSKGTDLYLSDWKNGKVFKLDTSMDGSEPVVIKKDMQGSADIDITTDGKYLIIPEMKANRVVIHPIE